MNTQSIALAVITAISVGIGFAYFERLLRRGFHLLLVARNREGTSKTGFPQIEKVCYEMRVV